MGFRKWFGRDSPDRSFITFSIIYFIFWWSWIDAYLTITFFWTFSAFSSSWNCSIFFYCVSIKIISCFSIAGRYTMTLRIGLSHLRIDWAYARLYLASAKPSDCKASATRAGIMQRSLGFSLLLACFCNNHYFSSPFCFSQPASLYHPIRITKISTAFHHLSVSVWLLEKSLPVFQYILRVFFPVQFDRLCHNLSVPNRADLLHTYWKCRPEFWLILREHHRLWFGLWTVVHLYFYR